MADHRNEDAVVRPSTRQLKSTGAVTIPQDPPPDSLKERARRVAGRYTSDRLSGWAAEIAFYEFLSLIPFLIFIVSFMGMVVSHETVKTGMESMGLFAPHEVTALLEAWLRTIRSMSGVSLLSFGAIAALWSGSASIGSLSDALHIIYGTQSRPGEIRAVAERLIFTVIGATLLFVSLVLLVSTPAALAQLFETMGLGEVWLIAATVVRHLLALGLLFTLVACVYAGLSGCTTGVRPHLPGAAIATILLWLASEGFAVYVSRTEQLGPTFGSLGAILLLLLWLQITNLGILVGAAWNAESVGAPQH